MSNAMRSQWLFPKNEPGKVLGWEDTTGKYLENKSVQPLNANLTTLAGVTPGAEGLAKLADATTADSRARMDTPVYVATRTALGNLDPAKDVAAILLDDGRQFLWSGADLSSDLVLASVTTTSVDAGTDTATATAHGLKTGQAVIAQAVNGLVANTVYYLIAASANTFKLATSEANAAAGTAFDLTGTTNFTIKALADPLQTDVVIKTGDALDGSAGGWVGDKIAPQEGEIGGFTRLRLTESYQDGNPMLPQDFGCREGTSDVAIMRSTAGLQDALEQPFELKIPGGREYRHGPLTLSNTGCKTILGRGTLRASGTGQKMLVGTSIDGLRMHGVNLLGASGTGLTSGASTDTNLHLITCTDVLLEDVKSTYSRFAGFLAEGGSNIHVVRGDFSMNLVPVQWRGVTGGKWLGFVVDGSVLTPETFKTGPQLTAWSATYGYCEDIEMAGLRVLNLGHSQAVLAHAGKRIYAHHNTMLACAIGLSFNGFGPEGPYEDINLSDNFIDCLTGLSSAVLTSGSIGIQAAGDATARYIRGLIARNTILNANVDAQVSGHAGILTKRTSDMIIESNIIQDSYGAAIISEQSDHRWLARGNIIKGVTGTGRAYWIRGFDGVAVPNSKIEGGLVDSVAEVVRSSAAAGSNIMVDPNIMTTNVSGTAYVGVKPAQVLNVTTAVTNVDLQNVDSVEFAVGSAHSVSTVTNAVPGKIYTFSFSNGNTTIARGGGSFFLNASTNITGANRVVVQFRATSATALHQVAEESING